MPALGLVGELPLAFGPLCQFALAALSYLGELPFAALDQLGNLSLTALGQFSELTFAFGQLGKLSLALREGFLGGRELRPLFLELGQERRFARFGLRLELGLDGDRLDHVQRGRSGGGIRDEADDPLAIALVTSLDLGAEARAEALLGRQLDAVLRRERVRKLGAGDHAELDDRLAQTLARHLLLCQRTLEIVARQQSLLDEQPSEGAPGDVGRFHRLTIGIVALSDKTAARNASKGVGPCDS